MVETITLPPESPDSVVAAGLTFKRDRGNDYSWHGKGLEGLTLIRSFRPGYMGEGWHCQLSHWLDSDAGADRKPAIWQFSFELDVSLQEAAERTAAVTFQRLEAAGLSWLSASTGHAQALDDAGEPIRIEPVKNGWDWERGCVAVEAFNRRLDDPAGWARLHLRGVAASREDAMAAAAAAKERLRGAVAELALALGVRVVS